MADVVIVNSPLFREVNDRYDEDSLPPLGLGYIATNLRNNGHLVELIDAVDRRIPLQQLITRVKSISPKVIATNIFTTNYSLVKEFIESINDESIHIIIGGLSTRELYKDIMQWDVKNKVDIVAGDGEFIIVDLIGDCVKQAPFLHQDNFKYYQVFNSSSYYLSEDDISSIPLDRHFFDNEPILHPFGFFEANIVTSRGCVYNCAFCAAARSLNKDFADRERSIESVRNELIEIKSNYPYVNSIRVLDDLFLKGVKSIQRAIDTFSGMNLQWRSMAHVQTFRGASDEILKNLKESNCKELFIGIESGSPKILKLIKKTHDVSIIKESMVSLFRAGINVKGYFIYGFPGEKVEDMEMTYELATYLRDAAIAFGVQFRTSPFQFRPYHGTELYDKLLAEGKIDGKIHNIQMNHSISESIGRQQFNFHSGNFSDIDSGLLYEYICETAKLNPVDLFEKSKVKNSKMYL